jgi:ribosomal protein L9
MDAISSSTGSTTPVDSDQSLQREIDQVRMRQAQIYSQMQDQLMKQSKGPSGFRKVLGVLAGAAAGVFAPGLGNAVGTMVMGNSQANSVNSLVTLNAMNTFAANAGLAGNLAGSANSANLSTFNAANDSNKALQEANTAHLNAIQQELTELAGLPKGPDPVSFLALAEKTNTESEIFQATTAIAKAKHEAAMAAIQNIKD